MTKKTNHLIQITIMYIVMAVGGVLVWNYFFNETEVVRFLYAHLGMTVICFVFSLLKKNSSVYDAFWSVIPFYFVLQWIFLYSESLNLYHWIAFAIVSSWSWRLTLNWVRSWLDFSHEDWRYVKLAQDTGKFYPFVNFSGIHLFPTALVFGGMWPLFALFTGSLNELWIFALGSIISLTGILFEFFADNQLFKFRNRANAEQGAILETGLWGVIRYPNYLGEMLFWIGLFLIGYSFGAVWYTGVGALSMCILFVFISIPMKEKRMLERRTNYPDYQKRVPMLIPRPWK